MKLYLVLLIILLSLNLAVALEIQFPGQSNTSTRVVNLNITTTGTGGGQVWKFTDPPYLFNNTNTIFFNESKLNSTILNLANFTDTTCNSTGACAGGDVAYLNFDNIGGFNITGRINFQQNDSAKDYLAFYNSTGDLNGIFVDASGYPGVAGYFHSGFRMLGRFEPNRLGDPTTGIIVGNGLTLDPTLQIFTDTGFLALASQPTWNPNSDGQTATGYQSLMVPAGSSDITRVSAIDGIVAPLSDSFYNGTIATAVGGLIGVQNVLGSSNTEIGRAIELFLTSSVGTDEATLIYLRDFTGAGGIERAILDVGDSGWSMQSDGKIWQGSSEDFAMYMNGSAQIMDDEIGSFPLNIRMDVFIDGNLTVGNSTIVIDGNSNSISTNHGRIFTNSTSLYYTNGTIFNLLTMFSNINIAYFNQSNTFTQQQNFEGNINQTVGNATITLIYGEMWFLNDSTNGSHQVINTIDVWEIVSAFNQTSEAGRTLNGFEFVSGSEPRLVAQVSSTYHVDYALTYRPRPNAPLNQELAAAVSVNRVIQNNTWSGRIFSTSGTAISSSGTGFITVSEGDNITLEVVNNIDTGDVNIYSSNINLIRVGI